MRIFGLAGWSGAGKTTLGTRLLPALMRRGVSVSTLKHAHHDFDVDREGKDSWRHRQAGAREVMVVSDRRWALMHELRGASEPSMAEILDRMSPVDLVLVEGYKRGPHPKIEVYRAALGKPVLAFEDDTIVAIASDAPVPKLKLPFFALDDVEAIASFVIVQCRIEVIEDGAAQR
jgi:molybdopterin-guanine dinucleotide biosynthesis adapter protein